jgi:hypothetical protein
MKKTTPLNRLTALLACAVGLFALHQANAGLLFYEPFAAGVFPDNFALGKSGTNGWSIGNSDSSRGCSMVKADAALSYEGLAVETGSLGVARSTNTTVSHRNVGKPFGADVTSGAVYCSFLVKAVTLPVIDRCVLSLNSSTGFNGFVTPAASVWLDAAGRLLIGKNSTISAPEATAALGEATAFVVLKYTFKDGADDDEVALYLNIKPGQDEPLKPSLATVSGEDVDKIVAFGLPQGRVSDTMHGADSGEIYLDEIRVGDSWDDVTPAAGSEKPSGK